jgi:hypothetical protein
MLDIIRHAHFDPVRLNRHNDGIKARRFSPRARITSTVFACRAASSTWNT